MDTDYLAAQKAFFGIPNKDRAVIEGVIGKPSEERRAILRDLHALIDKYGLAYGFLVLYKQQVNSGFVLADPLNPKGKEVRRFSDPKTGIEFCLMWNPDRELRRNHGLLIQRGVVAEYVDASKLINRDKDGKPCYLCKENIALQNPAEVLLPLQLGGRQYLAGANFAPITNNHFTIMSAEHRAQRYDRTVLAALIDLVEQTEGYFGATFNGLAAPSIPWHEHMQITTERFPIENIHIEDASIVHRKGNLRVSKPFYYVPLWVVEGTAASGVQIAVHRVVKKWHMLDRSHHTVNLISTKKDDRFLVFVILRDTRKLTGTGKVGAIASFECGGTIVLSYVPDPDYPSQPNERETFDSATLHKVRKLLTEISPEKELTQVDFE